MNDPIISNRGRPQPLDAEAMREAIQDWADSKDNVPGSKPGWMIEKRLREVAGIPKYSGPRPLEFVRVRLYRGGQATLIREILEDERKALFDDIKEMRGRGVPDDSDEVMGAAAELRYILDAIRDLDSGMIELMGGDGA